MVKENQLTLTIILMNVISIREFEANDKNEVIHLFKLNTPPFFAVEEEEDLIQYLEKERELFYVLLSDQTIVGCGGINFTDSHTTGKLSWDIIHPLYQGKSLGSKLLTFRLNKLRSLDGLTKIMVRTSQLAFKFYEKHGFECVEIKQDYWAKGLDMYTMEFNPK